MSHALKLVLLAIAFVAAGVAFIVFFGAVWLRAGFGGAFLLLAVVLLLIGWRMDRKEKKIREGLGDA